MCIASLPLSLTDQAVATPSFPAPSSSLVPTQVCYGAQHPLPESLHHPPSRPLPPHRPSSVSSSSQAREINALYTWDQVIYSSSRDRHLQQDILAISMAPHSHPHACDLSLADADLPFKAPSSRKPSLTSSLGLGFLSPPFAAKLGFLPPWTVRNLQAGDGSSS